MAILVLGITSPIARALANRFAREGHAVYAAARDLGEAETIAADIAVRYGVATAAGVFDARDFESHREFVSRAEAAVGELDLALLAFGDMGVQAELETDFAQAHRVIDVNYTGCVSICEALAERMSARGRGTIIGLSSVAGDRGRASNYIYGSAKGAFTLYLQGLRNRLYASGARVLTVKLGFVNTRMTFGMKTGIPIAEPEAVAESVFRAWSRGEDSVYLPRFWQGIMAIIKLIPEPIFKRLSL